VSIGAEFACGDGSSDTKLSISIRRQDPERWSWTW